MANTALRGQTGHPEIRPAFGERNLPVVMVADGNYIPYLRVVLRSILASTTSRNLDVLVLHSGIDGRLLDAATEGFEGNPRMSIRFVDIGETVAEIGLSEYRESNHLTVAAVFKLLAPELLTGFDRAIYLDIDLVVHRDLGELFDTDLEGAIFGGVYDAGVLTPLKHHVELAKSYGCGSFENYINTGVMVVDFKAYREAGLLHSMIATAIASSKAVCFADQDAINFNCRAKIRQIDPRWNVQVGDYCIKQQMEATGGEAYITHFTGAKKPWNAPWHRMAHLWWHHAGEDGTRLWRAAFGVADEERTLGDGIVASVVVAIYNAAPYIAETLVSLRAQTLRNIEIICVDDGSTDGTSGVLAEFAARDSRIKVVTQKNSGGAVARNRGLDEARGRWLLVADADDFSRPDMLADMVAKGEAEEADIVAAGYYSIDQRFELAGNPPKKHCEPYGFGTDKPVAVNWRTPGVDVFSEFCLAAWNKLYSADFIKRTGIRYHRTPPSDDTFFVVVAFGIAERIVPISGSYYYYRSFIPSSQLSNSDRYPMSGLDAVRDVVDYFAGHDRSLRLAILGTSMFICIDLLCWMRTGEGFEKVFYALRDGGLKSLIYSDIDASEIDAKSYDGLYRMLLNGANMADFLLERCRRMEVWAIGLDARRNEARRKAEKCRADFVAMRRRCDALTAERNLLRERLGQRAAHPADESVVKKIRGLVKEFVPYAIERDYCRRRYGLVNRWDARKTKGILKKAARFCFELLPYGFVYRFSAKRYPGPPPKANRRRKPGPAQNPLGTVGDGLVPFDPEKPNCIIVVHESSRTGCPINTWSMLCELTKTFNVLAVSLKQGPMDDLFRESSTWCAVADASIRYKGESLETWLAPVLEARPYAFAIANSVCTWALLPVLSWHRIPSIVCIHEFAQYCDINDLKAVFLYGTTVVYSSHICLKATADALGLDTCNVPVIAQGKSALPVHKTPRFDDREANLMADIRRRKAENGEFVVLGAGTVTYRKGFDLFLRTAAEIQRKCPSRKFRFVWAGDGFNPERESLSKMYKAQIDALGLSDSFDYLGPIKSMDELYKLSDLFLLTSVLDPLPGVVIEAMSFKVPVLCFDKASGFPEMLSAAGLFDDCVVDYLSVEKMSDRAVELVNDDAARRAMSGRQYDFCRRSFNMPDYVARIVALAPKARESFAARTRSIARDARDRFLEDLRAATAREIGLADTLPPL